MPFTATEIKDRVAMGDDLFRSETLSDGRIRLIPAPDEIVEPGTDINKQLLQPIVDELDKLSELNPTDCETERRSGNIPEDIQIQSSATVINGCYLSCPSTLIGSDEFNGIVDDADSAIAVLPVVSGQTYTIFFPGVTTVEILKNAASLSTFKRLFRGFIVIDKAYALNSLSVLDVAEWIENSEIKLDGYSKCNTGTSNPDLFNSGYYATFTVPDGADTVIFNAALSETAKSAKMYDFRDSFIVFEGTMSDTVELNVNFVTRFGNLVVRDIETANALKKLEATVNSFYPQIIETANFCEFESGFSPDEVKIYLSQSRISAHFRYTTVSLSGSGDCFKIGKIKDGFIPSGTHVGMVNVTAQSGDNMQHISGCGYINGTDGDGDIYVIIGDAAYYEYLDVNIEYYVAAQGETE